MVRVARVGIDLSTQRPKSVDLFRHEPFDYVITVCDSAKSCPVFTGRYTPTAWVLKDPRRRHPAQKSEVLSTFAGSAMRFATGLRNSSHHYDFEGRIGRVADEIKMQGRMHELPCTSNGGLMRHLEQMHAEGGG
jgi:hypothetical protein